MSSDTSPSLKISEETSVRMPLKLLLALGGIIAVCAIAYQSITAATADHDKRISAVENEQRQQREILTRIDENVKSLKEAAR